MDTRTQLQKGVFNGPCNRTACQQQPATWWNPNTNAWYCAECALKINAHCPSDMPEWRLTDQLPEPQRSE